MTLLKMTFLILTIILLGVLSFIFIMTYKSHMEIRKSFIFPMIIGMLSMVVYTGFVFANNYYIAMLLNSIYFGCMTWLTYAMLKFTYAYTEHTRNIRFKWIFISAAILDSISLIVNMFTYHSFDLTMFYYKGTFQYWGTKFNRFHYAHLTLCYIFIAISIVMMIKAVVKASAYYKRKYTYVLGTYSFVILLNFLCYSLNLPIDFSVLFYAVLAGFICYYNFYSFPHHLVTYLLDNVNEKIDDGIIFFDKYGKYAYSNTVARQLMKDSDGNFSPKAAELYVDAWKSIHPETEKNGRDSFMLNGTEHHFTVEYQTLTSDGAEIGSFFKFVDKTKETKLYLKERYHATHDELTKLYNRMGFFEAVEDVQKQIKDNVTYIMLCSNIKDFKLVNEIFGDKIGDKLLIKQAELIRDNAHQDTVCGRIGDDKFAMYLRKDYFDESFFLECIAKLRGPVEGSDYQIKIHVGIYQSRLTLESPQIMCDKALLACKQISSDYQTTFAWYNSNFMKKMVYEKVILSDFDTALNENQFKIYLQPQIAYSGKVTEKYFGTETIIRWNHPQLGLLHSQSFIEMLEKNGLIHKLDMFVWEVAAKKLKEWSHHNLSDMSISVNMSVKDMYYIDVLQTLIGIVEKYEIAPKFLNIEITETSFMENFEMSKKLMEELQSYGFKVTIDDFGRGYSSLNMLKDMNADVLKIGHIFLSEVENQERSNVILKTIISMAKSLGMEVLATDVESTEQVNLLTKLGCEHFQGSLFSAPIPIEVFEQAILQ